MAEIVGAFALPHTPFFPALAATGGPPGEELRRLYGAVEEAFAAAAPDRIVFFLPDHLADNFETIPVFDIGVAESASGPLDDTAQAQREVPIDSALATAMHRQFLADGFDVALAREPRFDHSSLVPLGFLTPALEIPIVPIRIGTFVRPLASARRCFELGRSARRAIEESGPGRVAVLATGNFSLEIGGPRMDEDHYTGITDRPWVDRVVELLGAAEVETLLDEATPEQIDRAGAEAGEILLWSAMLGTFDPRPPTFLEPQKKFGQAFAAWSLVSA
jgi:hypothetical protein